MKYDEIKKMLEKYKAPFEKDLNFVSDNDDKYICECETKEEAKLICFALNFMAQSFSVIREN
jgi:hypothetical protein